MCVYVCVIVSVINIGGCISWRQTSDCDPDGKREPEYDKECSRQIKNGWSGYCECGDGSEKMKKGCGTGTGATCNDACGSLGK